MDEFLALAFHQERGLDCVIARFFNTVGPRQQGQYGMVIPRFVGRAVAGEPLEIHGDGTQTRSFCHVRDTIQAVYGLMESREISGEIFNVGSAERLRIIDLAHRVLELTGSSSRAPSSCRRGLRPRIRTCCREPSIEDRGRDRMGADAIARRHPRRRDRVQRDRVEAAA
jgi:nucleoside-diphosphate-sugar epimerase